MKMTQEIIDIAKENFRYDNDYKDCIQWCERVLNINLTKYNTIPRYLLWLATINVKITDFELFDWCVEQEPENTICYTYHNIMLTPEQLDRLAKQDPLLAIRGRPDLLTPERLDWCAKQCPRDALDYIPDLLTPERLDWCAKQCPETALICVPTKLTPERLDWCIKQYPTEAVLYVRNILTSDQLEFCKNKIKEDK